MQTYWVFWVLGIGITFGIAETFAIRTGRATLSRTVWNVSAAFPPFPWIVGVLVGFLACHFWWGGAVCFSGAP